MKLLIAVLLSPLSILAQKYSIGFAEYQTKLYKRPYFYRQLSSVPDSQVVATVKNGSLLACYNPLPENNGDWLKVIYGEDTGYIVSKVLTLDKSKGYPLAEINPNAELENYLAAKTYVSAYLAKAATDERAEVIKDSLEQAKTIKSILTKGIGILGFELPSDDYSVGLSIAFMNTAKQTIKYIWVTVNVYNPVDDLIGTKTLQCVGPIAPNESGAYKFENILFTRVFDWGRISKIKIQYMNGTFKELAGSAVQEVQYK